MELFSEPGKIGMKLLSVKKRKTERVFCMLKLYLGFRWLVQGFLDHTGSGRGKCMRTGGQVPQPPSSHQNIPDTYIMPSQRIPVELSCEPSGTQLANSSSLAFSITPADSPFTSSLVLTGISLQANA